MKKTRPAFSFVPRFTARLRRAMGSRLPGAMPRRQVAGRSGAGLALSAMAAAGLAACASAGQAPAPPMPAPASETAEAAAPRADPLLAFEWVRGSAEHRAIFLEIYHAATVSLDSLAAGRSAGAWGVILDGDETILDNSSYEVARAERGLGFTEESWSDWVRREAAPALPGARGFLERVHALGGRVVIVTNRRDALCPATRANLAKDSLAVDLVLCRRETSDKNPRFQAVQDGTASPDIPPLHVLMWLGDNIQDFPHLSQAVAKQPEGAFRDFGRIYFMLPNPMYGSWQRR